MQNLEWQEEVNGTFIAESARHLLMVRRQAKRRFVRFLVRSCNPDGEKAVLGSGTAVDIGHGMSAAERMAERLARAAVTKPLVMVVDDDLSVRSAVAETLRDEGYSTAEASCGEGALRRLERTTRPVVLVTDVNLDAKMSGLELATAVQTLWPKTGILLISGDGEVTSEVLAKPFSGAQLLQRVAAIAVRMQAEANVPRSCPSVAR